MLEEIYSEAIKISREGQQTTGEKNDYFITLAQLEAIIKSFQG